MAGEIEITMQPSPVFLIMGVCGAGKSAVAQALAGALNGTFLDGDDYHLAEHVKDMSAGIPLNDLVRKDWLRRVCRAIVAARRERDAPVFIACSALKKSYRDFIRREVGPLCVLHLAGDPELIRERMTGRPDHFMPISLIESQFRDLEPPRAPEEGVHVLDISPPLESVVHEALAISRRVVANAGSHPHAEDRHSVGNTHRP
ncbi:MAG TPA: gluconokinase [Aurantimonas sp.]